MRFKAKPFDLKSYRKNMADFNRRFPRMKGMMYNLDGKLEPVVKLSVRPRVKVLKESGDFAVQMPLF